MMDNFEKNIRENKAFFNDKKSDKNKIWDAISKELDSTIKKPKTIVLWKNPIFKIAAILVIALGLFSIAGPIIFSGSNTGQEETYASQEVLDIETHYNSLVAYHVKQVQNHSALSEEDKKEFLSFMQELDQEYAQLKLEMNKNLNNELILEALISNYKKRIELIENLLKQINSSKKINDDYGYTL